MGDTGDGVLTEVYVDVIDKTGRHCRNQHLPGQGVDDYDERNDEATYAVWSIEDKGRDNLVKTLPDGDEVITTDLTVNGDDFASRMWRRMISFWSAWLTARFRK